jgi:hypothetical protein
MQLAVRCLERQTIGLMLLHMMHIGLLVTNHQDLEQVLTRCAVPDAVLCLKVSHAPTKKQPQAWIGSPQ